GRPLHLYPACRKLLEVLMQASPAAVTRERLEQALWGDEPPDGDMLRSHIYDLRRSVDGPFAEKLLHTLPRVGYRLGRLDPSHEA
ncbi:helix-turn-helix domain-containing protein, partial [Xanthomonas sp. Kuri4-3]